MLRDITSSHVAQAQMARSLLRHRLYGMKYVSECSCHPSADHPVEIMDSTTMETRPLRRR